MRVYVRVCARIYVYVRKCACMCVYSVCVYVRVCAIITHIKNIAHHTPCTDTSHIHHTHTRHITHTHITHHNTRGRPSHSTHHTSHITSHITQHTCITHHASPVTQPHIYTSAHPHFHTSHADMHQTSHIARTSRITVSLHITHHTPHIAQITQT